MKPVFWLIPALLLLCITARAQETPAWEASGGYSYLKADLHGSSFHLNGGTISATENLNNWFGGRLEVSAYHGNVAGTSVSAQTATYGPVLTYRHLKSVVPFVHAQFGAIHGSQGYLGISQSAIKFAMVSGAGVDIRVGRRTSIRLQGDYMMSRFLGLRQDNLQGLVGVVYRFGKK
jgi:hypothetical protein